MKIEKVNFDNNFHKFNYQEKLIYLKKILKKNNLTFLIEELIKINQDLKEAIELINDLSKTTVFKNKIKIKKLDLVSLIINSLINQNKSKFLYEYLENLDNLKLEKIINYEITNKTLFSHTKLCKSLKKELDEQSKRTKNKKVLVYDDKSNLVNQKVKKQKKKSSEIEKIKTEKSLKQQDKQEKVKKESKSNNSKKTSVFKKEIKSKKVKWSIGTLIIIFIFVISYILVGYLYSIILFYNNHVYPNIYLDEKLIDGKSYKDLKDYFEELELDLTKTISFKNENDTYEFTYEEIGINVNTDDLEDKIILAYQDFNGFQKIKRIFSSKDQKYEILYTIDEIKYQSFLANLKNKVNVLKTNEKIAIINDKISYTKGVNGYVVDTNDLDKLILASLENGNQEITLNGHLDKVSNQLSVINKKVGTYTTYYNESQGRAKNIRNAVSRLNGKILYPNETFSFYKTVGPYNGTKGYVFYDKDVGSGVCQVSTTIYNVVLPLNLQLVSRSNHGDMVYYVDYGMDATVYGSSVDFKFKNNSSYPIYIEASAKNGALTVSFWSNENIIKPGYSYKPRVEKISYLGFRTYLDTYYEGKYQGTTYLNTSYYAKGK